MPRKSKASSLADIEAQIEQLKKQAEELRAVEVEGFVSRIKEAIAHYGLTAQQLGFGSGKRGDSSAAPRALVAKKAAKKTASKKPSVAKYADGAGRTWTGHGKRPGWFKDAIAAGKSPDDLLVVGTAS